MKQAGCPYHWRDILPVFVEELAIVSHACCRVQDGADPEKVRQELMLNLDLQDQDDSL